LRLRTFVAAARLQQWKKEAWVGDTAHRILVADADPATREESCRLLAAEGYEVAEAEDGRVALHCLQSRPFDFLLVDAALPDLDGYGLVEYLRAHARLRSLPVVATADRSQLDALPGLVRGGVDDFLVRPLAPEMLKTRLAACLARKQLRDQDADHLRRAERGKRRAERLLNAVLPATIGQELMESNAVQPRRYDNVAVLFADVVGFTQYCQDRGPSEILDHLQEMVIASEAIAAKHDVQKIKTIGDCFMGTAGLLKQVDNPVARCTACGLEMIAMTRALESAWDLRVGVHIGPVIAGVVGHQQYLFDVWGDTVNTAARIETYGQDGAVNLSREAWDRVADGSEPASTEVISVKGKGSVEVFRLLPPARLTDRNRNS